jgi:hypothetical protein
MIPYKAIETSDAEAIVPGSNIGLIVLNFLAFFYELSVALSGGDDSVGSFAQAYALSPASTPATAQLRLALRTHCG